MSLIEITQSSITIPPVFVAFEATLAVSLTSTERLATSFTAVAIC